MGKKSGHLAIFIAVLLILALATLTSCRSISSSDELSAVDCDYTLHLVKDQTQDQAISELFKTLNSYGTTFIPSQYAFLETFKDQIPGMGRLINQWAGYISDYLIVNYDSFTSLTNEMLSTMEFKEPQAMIVSSDSSITDLYRQVFFSAIEKAVKDKLSTISISYWQSIVTQYNAWVATQALLGTSGLVPIKENDIVSKVATLATELYFSYFSQQETLIRTTPNPDMDSTAASVLGLD